MRNDPHDFLKLNGKRLRRIFLGSMVVGGLTLGLWHKHEQIALGQQRLVSYVSGHKLMKPIVLSITIFLTDTRMELSFARDTVLPGWNGAENQVDCIGGGGGAMPPAYPTGGGGGGGGGFCRGINIGDLPPTVHYGVGVGGNNAPGGSTWFPTGRAASLMANGGALGGMPIGAPGGSASGGDLMFNGGRGGDGDPNAGENPWGGGGGGAAGPGGNGVDGLAALVGASGGAGGGGLGGLGCQPGQPSMAYNNGREYDARHGSGGGGGGGAWSDAYTAGLYGGGGGGGCWMIDHGMLGGAGGQGLICIVYTPLLATAQARAIIMS